MGYVESNLISGEHVVFTTKLHWAIFVKAGLWAAVLLAISIPAFRSAVPLGLVFVVLAVAIILSPYLRWEFSEFAVTNKRVLLKTGVLETRSFELLLGKIEGIAVDQDFMGKIFGMGTIAVRGTGGSSERFANIALPFEFRKRVQEEMELQREIRQNTA